eukprot:m.11790 g.11790  ORF g.11790 m.11790 type:complete len:682 (+) comp4524_c0_seq1:361-2406(+)
MLETTRNCEFVLGLVVLFTLINTTQAQSLSPPSAIDCTVLVPRWNMPGVPIVNGTGTPCGYMNKCVCVDTCITCNNSQIGFATFVPDLQPIDDVQILLLGYSNITTLEPNTFTRLTYLKYLGLPVNFLRELPEGVFDTQTQLVGLGLNYNYLSVLPERIFFKLTKLSYLGLSDNRLTSLPALLLSQAYNAQKLFFNNNFITSIPAGFFDKTKMETAHFHNNSISSVSPFTAPFMDLFILDTNKMEIVSEASANFTQIYHSAAYEASGFISLANNPLTCLLAHDSTDSYTSYKCQCSSLYDYSHNKCVPPVPGSDVLKLLVILFCGLIGGLAIAYIGWWIYHNNKTLRNDLGIHRRLLGEQEEEMAQLKRAWDISEDEIALIHRIDVKSPGTFAEVWFASWDGLGVAVKRLKSEMGLLDNVRDEDAVNVFSNEMDFLRKCRHRNIVRFFGAGNMKGLPFLVVEYLEFGALSTYLRERQESGVREPWKQKLSFCLDIQAGMQHIHALGRMHRDLKSGNVLLSKHLTAKVADFGTIRDLISVYDRERKRSSVHSVKGTEAGEMTQWVGTPFYMAPEVLRQDSYGPPADIWAFGVIMWEIATQCQPDLSEYTPNINWKGPLLPTLKKVYSEGHRLPLDADSCPPKYADVVKQCMNDSQIARPTFDDLGDILMDINNNIPEESSSN